MDRGPVLPGLWPGRSPVKQSDASHHVLIRPVFAEPFPPSIIDQAAFPTHPLMYPAGQRNLWSGFLMQQGPA
jgi:hypothetical protein